MKKRKIFVGLLLGAAAFGLAACTTGGNSTTSGENTPSTTQGVTPTTSNTTPSGDNTQSNPTAQKYTVKYYAVVGDDDAVEVTAAAQEVEEGKTTTAPEAKLAKDGYKIVGYYTNEGCGEEFKFTTTITKNTKVYVKYVELSKYDELAASTNKVVAYDFNTATTVTKVTTLEFDSTTNEASIKTNSDAIKVQNDALTFGDVNGNALIDFGKKLESSAVYSVYYEMTFRAVESSSGSIAQLNGTTGSGYINVFELRNNKGKLAYNAEGKGNTDSALTIAANATIKVLIELDTADGQLTVDVNGTKIYDAQTNITGINGIKFQQDTAKSKFDVDNVAVAFEEKKASEIVAAKKAAIAQADAYLASTAYTGLDEKIKDVVTTDIESFKKDVNKATSLEGENGLNTLKSQLEAYIACEKFAVTVEGYSAPGTSIANVVDYIIVTFPDTNGYYDYLISQVSFSGYILDDIYSDTALTTKATGTDIKKGSSLYAKLSIAQTKSITEFKGYEEGYNGWSLAASAGTQKISPNEGENKDSANAVTCPKLDANSSLTSVTFDATKSITLTMLSSSTGTGNAVNVTVELLNGTTVVDTKDWAEVTTGKVTTKATATFTATSDFTSVRIKFKDAKGDTTKNFGIYSITGTISI